MPIKALDPKSSSFGPDPALFSVENGLISAEIARPPYAKPDGIYAIGHVWFRGRRLPKKSTPTPPYTSGAYSRYIRRKHTAPVCSRSL